MTGPVHARCLASFILALVGFSSTTAGQVGDSPSDALTDAPVALFTSVVQLVEVHVTVEDGRRGFVRGLTKDRFEVFDTGIPQEISVFEPDESGFSCALLLDTTGSMKRELPTLKRAILEFIDELRPNDSVAVYAFSTQLVEQQPFTTDKDEAKRAVLKTRAEGTTALFDSVYRVIEDLSDVEGKKGLLVFTDGDDNSSVLNARATIRKAKEIGVPIFAAAQGQALEDKALLGQINELCESTGGLAFEVRASKKARLVFAEISRSLKHAYLLGFQPKPSMKREWRTIGINVTGLKRPKVRAKSGYIAQP